MARFTGAGGGSASVTVSATEPEAPGDGDLWFDSSDASMYIYYVSGETGQWVQIAAQTAAGTQFDQFLLPGI